MTLLRKIIGLNLTVFLLFIHSYAVLAQEPEPSFQFETIEMPTGGLSNNVNQVVQDSSGFLWFATSDGLFRYDGQNFTAYQHDPSNENSISDNYIESIFIDKEGILWAASFGKGLNRFDPSTETFTHYLPIPGDSTSLGDPNVWAIEENTQGYVWVGTQNGLNRLDKKTGKFICQSTKRQPINWAKQ